MSTSPVPFSDIVGPWLPILGLWTMGTWCPSPVILDDTFAWQISFGGFPSRLKNTLERMFSNYSPKPKNTIMITF